MIAQAPTQVKPANPFERGREIDNPEGILAQLLENELYGDGPKDNTQSLAKQVIENVLLKLMAFLFAP